MFLFFNFLFIVHFSNISTNCYEGINYCDKCNPLTKLCIKCQKDLYTPDKIGGCQLLDKCIENKNYCKCCNEDKNLCKICDEGYFPDENGMCSYSDNCEISENGKCIKCKDNYILIGEEDYFNHGIKLCKWVFSENLKNCEKINLINGSCEKCKNGYYLNSGDKKCTSYENCFESIFNVCIKCNYNYYLNKKEGKCKEQIKNFENCQESIDGITCELCTEDYYFDENGKCISINYCLKELSEDNNNKLCEKCIKGYYLSGNNESCTETENCFLGDKNVGVCTFCKDGYYLDYKDGKCKSNQKDNDFKYCMKVEDGNCFQCLFPNYYLGEDNKCSNTQNCEESFQGKCIKCKDNYFFDYYNNCIKIENCKYSDGYECFECIDDYYYDINSKQCKMDLENYKHCKRAYEGWFCELCKDDFYLNQTNHLCYSNKEYGKFYKCEKTEYQNMNRCSKCIKNYYLGYKDNKCTNINGCILSDEENNCIECDYYHCLDIKNKSCEYNYKINNEEKKYYYRCKVTNEEGTGCQICIDNYTLNENGLCIDKEEYNCAEKYEKGICIKCRNDEEGYFCLNHIFGCIKKYFNKCLECNNILDFEKCTKCFEGYELNVYNECVKFN